MNIITSGETVTVTGVKELVAENATGFRSHLKAALTNAQKFIDIDLSETTFLDSSGLGALISFQKIIQSRNGVIRLINPTAEVQYILELTRLDRMFEIVKPLKA